MTRTRPDAAQQSSAGCQTRRGPEMNGCRLKAHGDGAIPDAAMDAFLRAAEDTPEGLSEAFYDSLFGECATDRFSNAFKRGMDRMRIAYAGIVRDGKLEERLDAFDRLGHHTDAWSESLLVLRGLGDSSELVRLTAVKALTRREHPALAGSVVPLLHDGSQAVRAAAAGALGALGDTSAVPELESLLAETDTCVFAEAVRSLIKLSGREACPLLTGAMLTNACPECRRVAILAVAGIGGDAAAATLRKSAEDDLCAENRALANNQLRECP